MKNRNKIYGKIMLALALGFSFAAEAANYTLNKDTATEKAKQENVHVSTKAAHQHIAEDGAR
ncbi:hypothetical protein ACXYMU_03025 [Pontibacter sp. CAU 1760]